MTPLIFLFFSAIFFVMNLFAWLIECWNEFEFKKIVRRLFIHMLAQIALMFLMFLIGLQNDPQFFHNLHEVLHHVNITVNK